MNRTASIAAAIVVVCATEARAQETQWYGGPSLALDAASLALLAGGVAGQSAPPAILGVVLYGLGGPIVHFVRGNVGRGFGSLGLRLGLPFVAASIGAAIAGKCRDQDCEVPPAFGGAVVGLAVGTLAAMVIDDGFIARDEPPPEDSRVGFGFTGRSVAFALRF